MKLFLPDISCKKRLKFILVSFLLLFVSSVAVYSQTYSPVAVTGFNQDVVANGSGYPAASTSHAVDNNADVLYVKGYQCSPNSALGLPINGSFTSSANNSINYQFANYDANNALYLTSSSINTLNLAQPKQFVDLSFLAFSTEGSSNMTIKLNFTDGSFSGAYPFIVYDWFNGPNPAISSFGRINNGVTCLTDVYGPGAPYMYDHLIHLTVSDQNKLVQSITITNTNGSPGSNSNTNGRVLVMAVSGVAGSNAPSIPTNPFASNISCAGFNANWTSVSTASGYALDVSTGADFSTFVPGYNNRSVSGTSLTIPLSTGVYYFRVRSVNTSGQQSLSSSTVPVNLNSSLPAPTISTSGATSFCPGGSVILTPSYASQNTLHFGSGSYIEAPSTPTTSLTNALSVDVWVKTDYAYLTQYVVTKGGNDQVNGQYGIVIAGGQFQFHMWQYGHQGTTAFTPIVASFGYHILRQISIICFYPYVYRKCIG